MNDSTSRPGIRNPKIDDNDYDMIFLGYPIWWEVAPTIINTIIESNDFQGATVIPFATSGGSTIENSTHALMQKYPEIKWKEGKLLNNVSDDDLEEWIKSIL